MRLNRNVRTLQEFAQKVTFNQLTVNLCLSAKSKDYADDRWKELQKLKKRFEAAKRASDYGKFELRSLLSQKVPRIDAQAAIIKETDGWVKFDDLWEAHDLASRHGTIHFYDDAQSRRLGALVLSMFEEAGLLLSNSQEAYQQLEQQVKETEFYLNSRVAALKEIAESTDAQSVTT